MAMTNDYNEYTEHIDPQGRKRTFRVFSSDQRRLLSDCLRIAAAGSLENERAAEARGIADYLEPAAFVGVAYVSKDRMSRKAGTSSCYISPHQY
jgi:hypothetical protein